MNKKALIFGGGAVAIVAIVVALIFIFTGGEDAYRSIKVFEIDGTCKVERDGDTLDAFKNMALSSGDTLTVGEGSYTRLKLDDDKYVYLEANTRISLTATGTANDSKTMVYIERGSMLTEVKKKLSATSSYDIVTPNTTMSIRGTKTLTEVYEDVLGAIKTSAAVVEGQVKFSTIQKDKTGKAVIVSTDLTVGQGYGVTTESKDLLSEDDVKHIADDGKTVDGQTAEETTHEELGSVLETPAFSDEFLTNIVAVLARSREEDIEEGFTAEDITEEELNAAINVLNDVIEGKVELPTFVEEYIVSQSQPYYEEPIVYDTPVTGANNDTTTQPQVENEPEQIADDTVVPEDTEGEGDDTFVVDGTGETLVGIVDDTDDNDAVVADDESDDETDAADEADEDGSDENDETEETDEDDKSDEGDGADEDAEDGDEDKTDDEDGEDKENNEEEDSDKETEEGSGDEEDQSEESETDSDSQSSEPSTVQDPNANDVRDPNGLGGGTSGQDAGSSTGTTETASYSYGSTTAYVRSSSSSSTSTPVTLTFFEERTIGGRTEPYTIDQEDLPTNLSVGSPLPGTENSSIHVDVSPAYEFAGWYRSQDGATNLTSSERVTTVQSGTMTLYPGVRIRTFKLRFTNLFPAAGKLDYKVASLTTAAPENRVLTYETVEGEEGNVITVDGFEYGDTFKLPVINDYSQNFEIHPYAHDVNDHPNYVGIGTTADVNIAKYLLDQEVNDTAYATQIANAFYPYDYNSNDHYGVNSTISVESDMSFYLYFAFEIDVKTSRMYPLEGDVSWNVGTGTDYVTMVSLTGTQTNSKVVTTLISDGSDTVSVDDQYWCFSTNGTNDFMTTYYYGKRLAIPSFTATKTGAVLGVLANYVLRSGSDVTNSELAYNEAATGSIARELPGSASASSLPFYDTTFKKIGYYNLNYEVCASEYTVFELGDSSVTYQIGDKATYINERDIATKRQIKTFFVDKEESGQKTYYKYKIPFDLYNDYATGNDLHENIDFITAAAQGITLSKSGYKVIGFNVRTSQSDSGQSILIGSAQTHSYGRIGYENLYNENSYYYITIDRTYDPSQVTVSPIFAPLKPFDVKLTRAEGTVNKRDGDPDNWAWVGYELEISGPGLVVPEGGAPFVTYIQTNDLKPYQRETTYYPVDNSQQELPLFNGIKWDVSGRKFMVDGNSSAAVTLTTSDDKSTATLKLKLKDLFNANGNSWKDANSQGYAGVHYLEYLTYFNNNGDVEFNTCFNNEQMTDGWCAVNVTGVESGYKPYKNYKADILANSEKFTAIDNKSAGSSDINITAVFNEARDTFATGLRALLAFGGYGSDSNKVLYGARLYDYYGSSSRYSNDSVGRVTLETDSSGGTAGQIINGNAGPGHGILIYETISRLLVPKDYQMTFDDYKNNVLGSISVYNVQNHKIVNGQIAHRENGQNPVPTALSTWGEQANQTMGLYMNIETEPVTVGNGSVNISQLPGGWTLITIEGGTYYINFASYGNAVTLCTYYESLS
ncbi:MAG: FecR domain-containing protein [Lachnospiraceae bacterium]|nr:FecR domain-containing protein [Lachnospiraceae bacterium]